MKEVRKLLERSDVSWARTCEKLVSVGSLRVALELDESTYAAELAIKDECIAELEAELARLSEDSRHKLERLNSTDGNSRI